MRNKPGPAHAPLPGLEPPAPSFGVVEPANPSTQTEERFSELMGRLEQIVTSLERGDLPLEDALRVFEEGVGLVRRGQTRLEQMERRVEMLMTDGTTRPFADAATSKAEAASAKPANRLLADEEIPF
jgi:exodeoxyribonuclease VII small subunit